MPMIGSGDQHRIDIWFFQHAPVIQRARAFAYSNRARQASLVNIRDRHHLDVVRLTALDQAAEVSGAHPTTPDDRETNAVVRSQNVGVGGSRESKRAGRQAGGFKEPAASEQSRVHDSSVPQQDADDNTSELGRPFISS